MAFDLMNLQKTKISRDLGSYVNYFYGESKRGKSTLCSKINTDSNLFICTEKGYGALNIYKIDLTSWSETNGLLRELKKPEIKEKFTMVTIDTVDILYSLCQDFVIKTNGVQNLADKPYGILFGQVDKLFNDFILGIQRAGYGITFVGHAKIQSKLAKKNNNTETEVDCIIPSLAKRGYQIISALSDNIFYCDIVEDEDGNEQRVLRTRATSTIFAGSRFGYLPEIIPMDADILKEEMQKAIDKEENTTDEKKNLFMEETKIDFNKIKEKLNKLVVEKFAPNDAMATVTKVVEHYLGTGNRVADATEQEADALQLIYDELLMYVEENNL